MFENILARLGIKGATKISSAGASGSISAKEGFVPIITSTGKLDPSVVPIGTAEAATINFDLNYGFSPPYNTIADIASNDVNFTDPLTGDLIPTQEAIQILDYNKLSESKNLSEFGGDPADTPFSNIKENATATISGVFEIATSAQLEAGSATDGDTNAPLAVTPDVLQTKYLQLAGSAQAVTKLVSFTSVPTAATGPTGPTYIANKGYVDAAIAAGVSVAVNTAKLLWVDQTATNAFGIKYRQDSPYTTITAAKAAAISGDTIMVLPGIYSEQDLLKDGVNYYFFNETTVGVESGTTAIFDGGDTDVAITCNIFGNGTFRTVSPSTGTGNIIHSSNNGLSLYIEALYIQESTATNSYMIDVSKGDVMLHVKRGIGNGDIGVAYVGSNGTLSIITDENIVGNSAIYPTLSSAGNLTVTCNKIINTYGVAITFTSGTNSVITKSYITGGVSILGGTNYINATKIAPGTSDMSNSCFQITGGTTKVENALITKDNPEYVATFTCVSIYGNTTILTFKGCDFKGKLSQAVISGTEAITVYLHGYNRTSVANVSGTSNVTFSGGMFEISSALTN